MHIELLAVGPFETNCFVVWGEARQALIIDPGSEPDRILRLMDEERLGVAAYLLTHGHMDHISALAEIHRTRPAPVAIHGADLAWAFGELNQMPPFFGVPERPSRIERSLDDRQTWTDGGLTYHVMTTPGHTPGSLCFHFADEKALFCGDTLFAGSVGRTDLPGGDAVELTRSLAKLARLPADTAVYPGHGPATNIGHEKQTNFFLQRL